MRKLVGLSVALVVLATACGGVKESKGDSLVEEFQDAFADEPVFDTEIRWDATNATVTIDQLEMQLPGFIESPGGELNPWPVLSSLYLKNPDGGQVLAAVGVLEQTFLATEGSASVLAIPWSFVGLDDFEERFTDDRTSGTRRCIVEYRSGEQVLGTGDRSRTIPKAMGVVLLSGPTTPPTVVIFQSTDLALARSQLDAFLNQVCP